MISRLPPGRRGLKHISAPTQRDVLASPSPRKAWIETSGFSDQVRTAEVAFPPEGVD